jgi:ABC-type uncharacterized transport system permease subunit
VKTLKNVASWLLVALIVLAAAFIAIEAAGSDPGKALRGFVRGAFGSVYGISEVLVRATPLMLAGLGVSVGFRSGFFNIGAEGQIYMGAAAATALALAAPGLPGWLLLPLAIMASLVAGGLWSAMPGFLKARFGLSEAINTIMLNYIALNLIGILVRTVLKDPNYPLPMSPELPEAMSLPVLMEGTRLHAGILIALASAGLVYVLMRSGRGRGDRDRGHTPPPARGHIAGLRLPRDHCLPPRQE